jgi:hypothetical protein
MWRSGLAALLLLTLLAAPQIAVAQIEGTVLVINKSSRTLDKVTLIDCAEANVVRMAAGLTIPPGGSLPFRVVGDCWYVDAGQSSRMEYPANVPGDPVVTEFVIED